MNFFNQLSLREKLAGLIGFVTVLALLCVAGGVIFYEVSTFRPRAVDQLAKSSGLLIDVLAVNLEFQDPDRAKRVLAKYAELQPAIQIATVYDQDGQLFAVHERSGANSEVPSKLGPQGDYFGARDHWRWVAVTKEEKVLGYLYLKEALPPLYLRLPQYTIMFLAVLGALALVGFTLLYGLGRNLLKPISILVQTTGKVIEGNDYSVRASVLRADEIGLLAQAFNRMIEVIGQRDADLRQAGARIQTVFDSATEVGIITTDVSGLTTLFNSGAERMLGYHADEVVGKYTPALWHVEEECASRGRELTAEFGCPVGGFDVFVEPVRRGRREAREWTMIRKNGSRFPTYLVVTALKDASGSIIGFLGVVSDITERKRADERLRKSQAQLEEAQSLALIGSWELEVGTNQSEWSREMFRLHGRPMAQGNPTVEEFMALVHPDDRTRLLAYYRAQLCGESVEDLVYRTAPGESGFRHLKVQVAVFRNPSGAVCQLRGTCTDVTKQLLADAQHQGLEEQLRQVQKMEAIGQLSGGIAHDFNNLLTIIDGNAALIQYGAPLTPDQQASLSEIGEATARAANLTRQLLTFSRRQTMQLKTLELNEVVTQMIRMLQRILGEDIRVELHFAPHPLTIRADAGMIEQVLLNLVVNSRDAMPNGGRLIIESSGPQEISVEEATQTPNAIPGVFVCLSVSDTGCGIAPEVLPKIFEPFYTTKDVGKGTGLGLATVYGIVQQHRGWVSVYSEVDRGTTIRVFLPHSELSEAPVEAKASPSQLEQPVGQQQTILLVEDEPSLRNLACKVLRRLGYTVLETANGPAALEVWRKHRSEIRLLLTDMVMPDGMSGRNLAQRLLQDSPHLPVIYTSGYSAEVAGKDFPLQEGVNFLAKPFTPSKLGETVRSSLAANHSSLHRL